MSIFIIMGVKGCGLGVVKFCNPLLKSLPTPLETVGFGGSSDLCAWQNRGNGAGVVMSTRVMGTHETGRRDVIRAGASGGMAESGVVEPSVTQHSVGGFNTDVSNMVGVTGNSNTGGMVSVSGVCDMGNVIADVAMGGMGSVTGGCRTSQVGGVARGVGHWFGVSNGSNVQAAGNTGGNGVTHAGDSSGAMAVMSTALFAHQLPPLSKFDGCTGPGGEGETVKEWLEQFELVAGVCKWDNQTKLVNLVTRLRGEAYAFFKSCSAQERSSYEGMSAALVKRFTPVRIQAVQSSLFHERKQGEESVDSYA